MSKRISIITPVLNRRAMLETAIESVRDQHYPNVEHIIVDGGSTDGTFEWAADQPDLIVLQDRRRGHYDALNIGLRYAKGDYIGWLNSDDLYTPGTFEIVAATFESHSADALCGFAELVNGDGSVLTSYRSGHDLALDAYSALLGACIPNARFFRRSVFDRVGEFSTAYSLVGDREFLIRCVAKGIRSVGVPKLMCRYLSHSGSPTFANPNRRNEPLYLELLQLARQVQSSGPLCLKDIQSKTKVLEGRCFIRLASIYLRRGSIDQVVALFNNNGRMSARPLFASLAAVIERVQSRSRMLAQRHSS